MKKHRRIIYKLRGPEYVCPRCGQPLTPGHRC